MKTLRQLREAKKDKDKDRESDDEAIHLSKFDPRFGNAWPSDKKAPPILMLQRKAIRVYPDHQKVALYYAPAIDGYVSIPFGTKGVGIPGALEEEKKIYPTDPLSDRGVRTSKTPPKKPFLGGNFKNWQYDTPLDKPRSVAGTSSANNTTSTSASSAVGGRPATTRRIGIVRTSKNDPMKSINAATSGKTPEEIQKDKDAKISKAMQTAKRFAAAGLDFHGNKLEKGDVLGQQKAHNLIQHNVNRLGRLNPVAGRKLANAVELQQAKQYNKYAAKKERWNASKLMNNTDKWATDDGAQNLGHLAGHAALRTAQGVGWLGKKAYDAFTKKKPKGFLGASLSPRTRQKLIAQNQGHSVNEFAPAVPILTAAAPAIGTAVRVGGGVLAKKVAPRIGKALASGGVAGKVAGWGKKALTALGLTAGADALMKGLGGGSSSTEPNRKIPDRDYESKLQIKTSTPQKTTSHYIKSPTEYTRPQSRIPVMEQIRKRNTQIQINEDVFDINTTTINKILYVHKKLNEENRARFATMLNESPESFRKAVNFALQY